MSTFNKKPSWDYCDWDANCIVEKNYMELEKRIYIFAKETTKGLFYSNGAIIEGGTVVEYRPGNSLLTENKYNRLIIGLDGVSTIVDVYCVQDAFPTSDPRVQHIQKKALAAGLRGHKDYRQDLIDIQESVNKAIEAYDRKISQEFE